MYYYRKTTIKVIALVAMLMLASCLPGRRHANTFLKKRQQIAVMIVPPATTFAYYYPFGYYPENPGQSGEENLAQSELLRDANIPRATGLFMETMLEQLKFYQVRVFAPEKFDEFLSFPGQRYIFSVAQTELVETDRVFTDKALIDTILYTQEFLVRTIERNTWFEFVEVDANGETAAMEVLYSTFSAADKVNGRFRYYPFSGNVSYEYTAKNLEVNDIYILNQEAGAGNAAYIFDFLLNRHIATANPQKQTPPITFNPFSKQLFKSALGSGFTRIQQGEE